MAVPIKREGWEEAVEEIRTPIKRPSKETVSVNSFNELGKAGSV
jgi:hypothetical protein